MKTRDRTFNLMGWGIYLIIAVASGLMFFGDPLKTPFGELLAFVGFLGYTWLLLILMNKANMLYKL